MLHNMSRVTQCGLDSEADTGSLELAEPSLLSAWQNVMADNLQAINHRDTDNNSLNGDVEF